MFDYIDQIKVLLSQDTWENILLNCTKNEVLVLMMLYRGRDINMSQIADYLNAPLNTTTGIVSRMEKKKMIRRVRSEEDKRVVTIVLTESGSQEIGNIMTVFLDYGHRILSALSKEEMTLLSGVVQKLIRIVNEPVEKEETRQKKIRKIIIE